MPSWLTNLRAALNERATLTTSWPWRTTAAQRIGLLRIIAIASEEHLPLYSLLEAWMIDERGVQKFRLLKLLRLLKSSQPLADAIEQIPGLLRDEDILAVRFGLQSGTLAATLRETIKQAETNNHTIAHPVRRTLVYCAAASLVCAAIIVFLRIKIIPVLIKICHDYSMELPWSMHVSNLFDQVVNYWWVGALILLLVAWSAFSVRPGRVFRNSILGRFFYPVRELRSADVLQKLGLAVEAGRPISGALSTLARYHFDPTIRHKLLYVRNEVEQGVDVWQSLSAVGLVNDPERRALEAADILGNRPWTLDQLAVTKRRRTMRRIERLSEWLLPVVVIAMGAIVLIQVLSVMGPLVSIINGLT